MRIDTADLVALLIRSYPGLHRVFISDTEEWLAQTGEISPCALFRLTSDLVSRKFNDGEFDSAPELFRTVERCLAEGTTEIVEAAATCFLENITNNSEIGQIAVHFMGELSKEHCRAWDKFTGVETPGLTRGDA